MKILSVFGTRPEAIKMAPIIKALEECNDINSIVCVTGQHKEMLYQVLRIFNIKPHHDLEVMSENQTLNGLSSRIISSLDKIFDLVSPDWVLVHGDTTTSMAASIAAFHRRVRIAHVEAGLRTHDLTQPWPEEMNRHVTDAISNLLFPPTPRAAQNLVIEGLSQRDIFVTGNTVIDALYYTINKIKGDEDLSNELNNHFSFLDAAKKTLLVTGHRRENFGQGFLEICNALLELSQRDDIQIVYPVHLNPNVHGIVNKMLSGKSNIHLIDPLDYVPFVWLMNKSYLILTDSGGVQEEAPSLGKPVLVMRDVTERPEAVEAGTVKLVGTSSQNIIEAVSALYNDQELYKKFSVATNPYGDGNASKRILSALRGQPFTEFKVDH